MRPLAFLYRLSTGALAGAQLFFLLVSTRVLFPPALSSLPAGDARKAAAGDLVGGALNLLDQLALSLCALAVLCAVLLARTLGRTALRSALLPLLAGLCAAASFLWVTPAIRAMRLAGQSGDPLFGRLHLASVLLLFAELVLLLVSLWRAPAAES